MSRRPFYLSDELAAYVADRSEAPDEVAAALIAETSQLPLADMQVSHGQATLLGMLVRATGAARVLEIGTFTGLSALGMAQALPDGGQLVACDVSEEWTAIGRRHWEQAGVGDRIDLRIGPALDTLASLAAEDATFDFAFVDADKANYVAYVDALHGLLRPDGLVAADNTLWSGRVVDEAGRDENLAAIQAFNDTVAVDPRWETVLLPIFDGLTLLRRR